eukprot:Platyproteum_vivax@DN1483_c0_g1_i1.p1
MQKKKKIEGRKTTLFKWVNRDDVSIKGILADVFIQQMRATIRQGDPKTDPYAVATICKALLKAFYFETKTKRSHENKKEIVGAIIFRKRTFEENSNLEGDHNRMTRLAKSIRPPSVEFKEGERINPKDFSFAYKLIHPDAHAFVTEFGPLIERNVLSTSILDGKNNYRLEEYFEVQVVEILDDDLPPTKVWATIPCSQLLNPQNKDFAPKAFDGFTLNCLLKEIYETFIESCEPLRVFSY